MRSKLVLTLWLAGAVLYAGSTAFLAHAVLGGGSVSTPADKAKATKVAAADDAQCEKDTPRVKGRQARRYQARQG